MLDFNSDGSDALIIQDIGSSYLGLTPQTQDFILPEQSLESTLPLSPESEETLVLRGTKYFDSLSGEESDDRLYGLAGNDSLNGNGGNDIINGGTGEDWLIGAKGDDILIDGDGGDFMSGGEGADEFWINNWDIPQTPSLISDFEVGIDMIKIGRLGLDFESLTFEDNGFSTTIYDNENYKPLATLTGINQASLTPHSFIFGDTALANQLQSNLEQNIANSETPGATQAIVTRDGFTWKSAAGFSNLKRQTPMHPDDIFSVASTTKAFTAATILKVVESGQISLDDTLGQRLPGIAKNISGGENIKLRQLLNGSAGIPSFNSTRKFSADLETDTFASKSPEEIVAYIYEEPLFSGFQSSPVWAYTNTADIIASLMVEQATGKDFAEVMQEKVIEPLGLDNTFYEMPEQTPENLARSYADILTTSINFLEIVDDIVDDITELDVKNISAFGASAAIFSDAEDVARFTQAIFGGELLAKESMNELVNFVDTGLGINYGLGIFEKSNVGTLPSGREWFLVGDSFGYNSQTLYLPDNGGQINTVLANRQYRSENKQKSSAAPILVSSNKILEKTA